MNSKMYILFISLSLFTLSNYGSTQQPVKELSLEEYIISVDQNTARIEQHINAFRASQQTLPAQDIETLVQECRTELLKQTPTQLSAHGHINRIIQAITAERIEKLTCIKYYQESLNETLDSILLPEELQRLNTIIKGSVSLRDVRPDEYLDHLQYSLKFVLKERIKHYRQELSTDIPNLKKLDSSVADTEAQCLAKIMSLSQLDRNVISGCFGDNLKEKIIQKMDIRCPRCNNFYKNEHKHLGVVEKVILKAYDQEGLCGHSACKDCATYMKKCLRCNQTIDRYDLSKQIGYRV